MKCIFALLSLTLVATSVHCICFTDRGAGSYLSPRFDSSLYSSFNFRKFRLIDLLRFPRGGNSDHSEKTEVLEINNKEDDDDDSGQGDKSMISGTDVNAKVEDDIDSDKKPLQSLATEQVLLTTLENIWENMITPSPDDSFIADVLNKTDRSSFRLNGTDINSFYRQLLSQFLDPLKTSGSSSIYSCPMWLDRDIALSLRGQAALSLFPELYSRRISQTPSITSTLRVSRGIRVAMAPNSPQPTHDMQVAVAKALAHSLGADVLVLDQRCANLVRRRAQHSRLLPSVETSDANEVIFCFLPVCYVS